MRLCLVEDLAASDLEPLTLTRPVFDLLIGASSIGTKIARAVDPGKVPIKRSVLVRPHLEAILRSHDPRCAVNEPSWLTLGPTIVANGRWVPPAGLLIDAGERSWVATCDGLVACAWVDPAETTDLAPHLVDAWFESLTTRLPCREVGGTWVRHPWDLIAANDLYLTRDFEASSREAPTTRQLNLVAVKGPVELLSIHASVQLDHFTALDTTNGPITIDAGVSVQPFTRIEGPCYIGIDSQLFRANLRGGVTLGPDCRIGGEVEQSIIHGHTNKYHEGFLGHSYIGEWVNLGAITSTSDLRNDYGPVVVPIRGMRVETGLTKVGCFLGDHTRTGMGSMINTGTVVGVMCNLLPAGPLLPKHVPSFAAVHFGHVARNAPLEQLFEIRAGGHEPARESLLGDRGAAFPGSVHSDPARA